MGTSNQLFQNLKSKGKISDKQLKYFTYEYKKVSNLGKLYLLRKIPRGYIMLLGDLSFQTVEHLWRKLLSF